MVHGNHVIYLIGDRQQMFGRYFHALNIFRQTLAFRHGRSDERSLRSEKWEICWRYLYLSAQQMVSCQLFNTFKQRHIPYTSSASSVKYLITCTITQTPGVLYSLALRFPMSCYP